MVGDSNGARLIIAGASASFRQIRSVEREPVPRRAELPHAILAVFTAALCFQLSHRDDGIDTPVPDAKLNPDRSEFDLLAVVFVNHAVNDRQRVDG